MSRCKACDRELSSSELKVRNSITRQPEDLCQQCRAVARNPNAAESYTQVLRKEIEGLGVSTPMPRYSSQHSEGE